MKVQQLHAWATDYHQAVAIQTELRERIVLRPPRGFSPKLVAGADVSYDAASRMLFAGVIVFVVETGEVAGEATAVASATFPYIPGLLTFREAPVLCEAFERLDMVPDAVMIDGHGIAHPRGLGIASHMGLLLDTPTVGCAKKLLVGEHASVPDRRGQASPIFFDGKQVGAVVRTRTGVKPVFASPGHKMDVDTAVELVLQCCTKFRIPEPTRRAHLRVGELRRNHLKSQAGNQERPI